MVDRFSSQEELTWDETAERQGIDAHNRGLPLSANPYVGKRDSDGRNKFLADSWNAGWADAAALKDSEEVSNGT